MKPRIFFMLSFFGLLLTGCDFRKEELAQRTIDSLRAELLVNRNLNETMIEVGVLLDSIDANRKVLHTRMVEGTNFESYVARVRDINAYVKRTQRKLESLEKTLRESHSKAYASALKKLRTELENRNHELAVLSEEVKMYQTQTEDLMKTVSLQKTELNDKLGQLEDKRKEVEKLDDQVKQLLVKSKIDEGEALYVRALAVEETANRTRFAPRKKRNTLREAIELYRQAQFFGKEEAAAKVSQLEKRVSKTILL